MTQFDFDLHFLLELGFFDLVSALKEGIYLNRMIWYLASAFVVDLLQLQYFSLIANEFLFGIAVELDFAGLEEGLELSDEKGCIFLENNIVDRSGLELRQCSLQMKLLV